MTHMVDPLSTLRPLREDELEHRATAQVPNGTAPLAYDVYRSGNQLVIEFDAPGVAPSDIAVSVEGRAIEVSLRRGLNRGPGIDVIEAGRQHGTFRQRLWLGDRWDLESLEAGAEHGVLTIRTPLAADVRRRTVTVTGAAATESSSDPAQAPEESSEGVEVVAGHGVTPAAVHSAA
ncbi:MAG TPA: Hsp20/alpha crystallin family protein [Acidimicrobiales bacterium]|nr:Hsp20/alpha crystallin family protein [Acidimicrobiales bacterium]